MIRTDYPIVWAYHRNTSRWPHNVHPVPEAPRPEAPFKEYFSTSLFLDLPQPELPAVGLRDAIAARYSCRNFTTETLDLARLSALLHTAYGVWGEAYLGDGEFLERPVPSGGGLYPLEVYLLGTRLEGLAQGVYHYFSPSHALEQVREVDLPHRYLTELFMGQPYVGDASLVIVLAAILDRSLWKYGDRGYRYILFEAGHVAQNINLVCPGLGLGSVNLGGFFDAEVCRLLDLDMDKELALYSIAVGTPAGPDRMEMRIAD